MKWFKGFSNSLEEFLLSTNLLKLFLRHMGGGSLSYLLRRVLTLLADLCGLSYSVVLGLIGILRAYQILVSQHVNENSEELHVILENSNFIMKFSLPQEKESYFMAEQHFVRISKVRKFEVIVTKVKPY